MGGDLRRLVLEFKGARFKQRRLGQIARLARDAHAMGRIGCGSASKPVRRQLRDHRITRRFQRVDADVRGRAGDEGGHLIRQAIAEGAAQFFFQALRILALHPSGRGRRRGADDALLAFAQRRGAVFAADE